MATIPKEKSSTIAGKRSKAPPPASLGGSHGNTGRHRALRESTSSQSSRSKQIVEGTLWKEKEGKKQKQFLRRQHERLLILKDTLLDSMHGVGRDSLRSCADGGEASAFGMHQADAGSDAYDRDFALSLLSQEQDSLYEIEQAIKRIENGSYGICEMCGKPISPDRLEALPFTRYTVECQSELERRSRLQRIRQPVSSLFGLTDEESNEGDFEESMDNKE